MEILVSFRGQPITVADVGRATAVASLKQKLEELTAVPVANQKLICKGKALRDENDTLESAGVVVRVEQSSSTTTTGGREQGEGTFAQKSKLMLVGSKPSEVTAVLEAADRVTVRNDFDGVVVPKGYKRVALNQPPGASDSSPYRFERIETLPGLPEEETARKILESLAADPGVRAVLEKHKWTVGALCELYPEGKVGISDTCVMGLNQNHGMKILLRLRTDDLRGFRKILSIRKVLFHELAHNEFSDHDDNFYMLMRQVEREAAELNWTQQSGGRTVAGRQPGPRAEPAGVPGGGGGFVLVKEAFEGGSGRLGGDSNALTHLFSARELAGQAAVQRLTPEEQEVEDCCGHTKSNKDAISAATAATPAATNTAAAEGPISDVLAAAGAFGAPDEAASSSNMGDSTAGAGAEAAEERSPAEVTVESLVSEMSVNSPDDAGAAPSAAAAQTDGSNGDVGVGAGGRSGRVQERSAAATTSDAMDVADDAAAEEVPAQPAVDKPPFPSEMDEDEPSASAPAPLSSPPSSLPTTSLPPSEQAEATASPQPPTPSLPSTPLDELLAMGFPREASMEALSASGGSIPDAAHRLLNPGMGAPDESNAIGGGASPAVAAAVAAGDGSGGNPMVGRETGGGEMRLPRDVRLQQAAERIGRNGDRARAVQCLDVLAAVFRNIMEHPEEAKFRKVRRSNGKFRASVGAVAGGVDLLLAAGFEERGGGDQLELGRQDPGLIWLAKSTVEAWQERLSSTRAP